MVDNHFVVGCEYVFGRQHFSTLAFWAGHCKPGDGSGLRTVKSIFGDCAVGVSPHEKESEPAEELHKSDSPEGLGGVDKKLDQVGLLLFAVGLYLRATIVFTIQLRRPFLHFHQGVDHADQQYGRAEIKREHHGLGNHT